MTNDPPANAPFDPSEIWDDYRPTRLIELPELARLTNVGRVFVKEEGGRPLGSFKVLGGMVAGLRALARSVGAATIRDLEVGISSGSLPRLICASDGNHGLAVAAAAKRAGAACTVYLPASASRVRAARIEAMGAQLIWTDGTYDDAVRDAAAAARDDGLLVPDTSADPNDIVVGDVMDGYAVLTRELVRQFSDEVNDRPTHILVQAGVGGLAAAMADGLCDFMQDPGRLLVVEPESAACIARALAVGYPVRVPGDLLTSAEMLACGVASMPALKVLQRRAARSVVVNEDELATAVRVLKACGGPSTTPSGAAGLAGLLRVAAQPDRTLVHSLDARSNVLLVATERALEA